MGVNFSNMRGQGSNTGHQVWQHVQFFYLLSYLSTLFGSVICELAEVIALT